jgi:FkbM family methyltransferase
VTGVKLRDLPTALGFKAPPREYGYEIADLALPGDGDVRFARWLHPAERPKELTQGSVDALRTFLRPGDVAIDIGAHTGDSALPMALAVGPTGTVFALEPNRYAFKILEANAALNAGKAHIVPLMFAAMPRDGEFEFEYSDAGYCNGGFHEGVSRWRHGHFSKLRVEGRDLAAYLRTNAPGDVPRIRYVKIDTEGFDRAVLRSLQDLLATVRPYLKTEFYKHLSDAERRAYHADLRRLGYRTFKWVSDERYRGEELGAADLSRWRHFDVFGIPEELIEVPDSHVHPVRT